MEFDGESIGAEGGTGLNSASQQPNGTTNTATANNSPTASAVGTGLQQSTTVSTTNTGAPPNLAATNPAVAAFQNMTRSNRYRPLSKTMQRGKGENFAEKLEKMLTAEGVAEFLKDKDDSTTVSDTPQSPGAPSKRAALAGAAGGGKKKKNGGLTGPSPGEKEDENKDSTRDASKLAELTTTSTSTALTSSSGATATVGAGKVDRSGTVIAGSGAAPSQQQPAAPGVGGSATTATPAPGTSSTSGGGSGTSPTQAQAQAGGGKEAGGEKGKQKHFLDRMRAPGLNDPRASAGKDGDASQEGGARREQLLQENTKLKEILNIIQQQSMVTEARFQEEIQSLQQKLDLSIISRLNDSEQINGLRLCNRRIQDEIASMRGIAEQQAQVEKENLAKAFARQIEQKAAELEEERRSGQNTTGEWLAKNRQLQDQVDALLNATEAKHGTQRELMDQNKALRVEFQAQADDKELLQKELHLAKHRNGQLKGRIHEIENRIAELQKAATSKKGQSEGDASPSAASASKEMTFGNMATSTAANMSDMERHMKYEESVEKLKRLIEIERTNLRKVKAAHLYTLSQRTELEVLLRDCIDAIRTDINSNRQKMREHNEMAAGQPPRYSSPTAAAAAQLLLSPGSKPKISLSEFTTADRRRVIEVLLSKERALQILYSDKPAMQFPTSAFTADAVREGDISPAAGTDGSGGGGGATSSSVPILPSITSPTSNVSHVGAGASNIMDDVTLARQYDQLVTDQPEKDSNLEPPAGFGGPDMNGAWGKWKDLATVPPPDETFENSFQ